MPSCQGASTDIMLTSFLCSLPDLTQQTTMLSTLRHKSSELGQFISQAEPNGILYCLWGVDFIL